MRRHDLYKRGRSCPVTCLSFGKNRKAEHSDAFFCHGCDLLEDAVQNGSRRANRQQRKYTCTAGHSDLAHPTTMKRQYRPINSNVTSTPPALSSTSSKTTKEEEAASTVTVAAASPASLSTSMSPSTKKQRRGENVETPNGWNPMHQQQDARGGATSYSCVTPSAASDEHFSLEKEKELMEFIDSLLIKNTLLEKKIVELDSSQVNLATTVHTLTSQMEQLQFQRNASGDSRPNIAGYHSDDDDVSNEGGRSSAHQQRRRRVTIENDKLSKKLGIVIIDFVRSPYFEDRRKFPSSRIAKIVIDSILSFEWTHSEFAKYTSRQGAVRGDGDNSDTVSVALTPLLNVVAMKRRSNKSKAALLVDCMWDDNFLDGEVKECMINKVRSYLRNHIFTPWKILKAMDLAGFNLSLSGLEVLRRVDVGEGKYMRGILPSKSTMLRTARKLEAAAESHCPFRMIGRTATDHGVDDEERQQGDGIGIGEVLEDCEDDTFAEGFEFDSTKVTRTLFEAFGLMDVAKQRSVELGLTSDGAQLTNTISHVAAGLKFNDIALCNPITKCPLLLHEPESLVQSRNLCFPLRIVIAKDSKKTLDGFRPLYLKFSTGEIARDLQCQSFKMSFPGDMKLQWGALDAGGAAKVKENFCFICSCRSRTLHVPRDKAACTLCKDENITGHCYHYPFLADPQVRAELVDELGILPSLQEDGNATSRKMYVRRPNEVMTEGDTMDIDYQPTAAGQSNNTRAVWARNITDELASREMAVRGTLLERQQRLREQLVNEQRAHDIRAMLSESEPKDRAMYLALQAVVCILHLENRVGLKSIESILRSGISNARMGVLGWIIANGVSRRQEEYVRRITGIMQTQILGSTFAPSQWRFPLTEEGNMGTLSMDNNRTRVVVNSIELLIEASFSDADDNKDRLLRCFPRYRAGINILRKDTNATVEEVRMFQDHIDSWFRDWVQVFGKEGCTNYTHMLSSSHVMRYMQEWKCLNRFSQQGWEALNALIKSYFFRRTNRGGLSKNAKEKSKLLGIARWLQRRIMWYSGNGDALFCDENDDDDSSYEEDNDVDSTTSSDLDDDVLNFDMEASSSDDDSFSDNDE